MFTKKVFVSKVDIYETWNSGGVTSIKGRQSGQWVVLWSGAASHIQNARIFSPPLLVSSVYFVCRCFWCYISSNAVSAFSAIHLKANGYKAFPLPLQIFGHLSSSLISFLSALNSPQVSLKDWSLWLLKWASKPSPLCHRHTSIKSSGLAQWSKSCREANAASSL